MKKIKVLALTLVFAFAALGGAYALWFDELYVNATAKTGIVDLEWTGLKAVDPEPNYTGYDGNVYGTDQNRDGLDTMDPGNKNDNKNIGSLSAEIKKSPKSDNAGDQDKVSRFDKLQMSLKNGYPGYQEYVDVKIKNVGTVPVKFEEPLFEDVPAWLLVDICEQTNADYIPFDLTAVQVEPGEEVPIKIVCRVIEDLGDGAICPQNATASFSISLKGVQWNEYDFDLVDEIQFPRKDNFPYPPDEPEV